MAQIKINDLKSESRELSFSEATMVQGGGLTWGEIGENFKKQATFVAYSAIMIPAGVTVMPGIGPMLSLVGAALLVTSPVSVPIMFTKQLIEDIQD
ncbi:MAG: hypothetical protein GY754_01500 [bacterium]|nr:hypothetical protein [bacterium]